jgi:hypothetical protein
LRGGFEHYLALGSRRALPLSLLTIPVDFGPPVDFEDHLTWPSLAASHSMLGTSNLLLLCLCFRSVLLHLFSDVFVSEISLKLQQSCRDSCTT